MHYNYRKIQSLLILSWFEIKRKYTRSILGPLWITLSTIILISGLSFVFVSLFNIPLRETMPWIAIGVIIWNFISMLIDEATEVFNKPILINIKISCLELAIITVFKNFIILGHNVVIILGIVIIFQLPVTVNYFYLLYGLLVLFVNSISVTIIFGMLCLRYRDFILIIKNLLYLLFLITPIFWMPSILTNNRMILADFNILFQIIQTVRDPLLGNELTMYNLSYTSIFSLLLLIICYFIYNKFKNRIVYWI